MEEFRPSFIDSLIGERIAGRYVVERELRSGGMGVVAAARFPELDQEVAIKFMRPEFAANPILTARFLREARLAARVKSPHFVRIFDFGKLESGVPFLVMEMLAGRDLRDDLDNRGALPPELAVDYVLQAMVGIAEVHSLGVVHRDLKPSNLFLSEAAGTETIKVLDFGVSKEKAAEGSALTSTGNLVGTPHYMSPEQVKESRTADVRSDVWSLGIILYELLTNTVPFGGEGEAIGEIYGLILHTDPTPPRARNAAIRAELEAVVMKCLKRDPNDRYADVAELAEALRPFAPEGASSRVRAIKQALAATKDRRVASDKSDPPSFPRVLGAATAESSPNAKRSGGGSASPTPAREVIPEEGPRAGGARETAMTASRPSDNVTARSGQRRTLFVVGGAVGGAIALAALAVASSQRAAPAALPSTASSAVPESTAAIPATTTEPAAIPSAAPAVPPALPSAAAPASSAPPAVSSVAAPPPHAKHRTPLPAAAGRPSAAPSASPSDLILDRK